MTIARHDGGRGCATLYELSNDPWDPPPAYMFEIGSVLRIGAEKAFLHKAFDDKPQDSQAEKHDTA